MPILKRNRSGSGASGNRKVMVYVAPAIHRAVRQVALDEGRSASDVYGAAALAFLEARGVKVEMRAEPESDTRTAAGADLLAALDRQGKRMEALQVALDEVRDAAPRGGQGVAGAKAAAAMKEVLGLLKAAGAAGVVNRELDMAVRAAGVRSGTAETAKAVLRGAGLVRSDGKRWYVELA